MMRRLIAWIRYRIRRFLGLGPIIMGVDVGFKDESCIVIASRLKNGAVRIIDVRFKSIMEIERLVRELQEKYGIRDSDVVRDLPMDTYRPSRKCRERLRIEGLGGEW